MPCERTPATTHAGRAHSRTAGAGARMPRLFSPATVVEDSVRGQGVLDGLVYILQLFGHFGFAFCCVRRVCALSLHLCVCCISDGLACDHGCRVQTPPGLGCHSQDCSVGSGPVGLGTYSMPSKKTYEQARRERIHPPKGPARGSIIAEIKHKVLRLAHV